MALHGVEFEGTIDADDHFRVSLVEPHAFDWGDGCKWQATDELVGRLTDSGWRASHAYREWPVDGEHCAGACSLTSELVGTRI